MKIFILGSYGPSLVNFRGDMIKAMVESGHEVIASAPHDYEDLQAQIAELGAKYVPIEMDRTGMNPFKDIKLIKSLIKLLKQERPDCFLSYTIKPNIYGSISAYFCGIENIYSMMTGSGSIIRGDSLKLKVLHKILFKLYRFAFSKCRTIFFLNKDDLELFKRNKIIRDDKTVILGSSGVNTLLFNKRKITNTNTFLFVARLIKDKGIYEFLEAATVAKKQRPNMIFKVLGPIDTNPTAIGLEDLEEWTNAGIVEYLGEAKDVRPYIENSFVITLPSYHEGQGRVLLEAMSMGRAVLATNVPGCRQTVEDGITGYLVPKKNVEALANKMVQMYDNQHETQQMAKEGHLAILNKYDVRKVNQVILKNMNLVQDHKTTHKLG
ncbi:glycosyltransferase family 4 protein [Alkalicoccus luteus]|uniref:Glycosyltransferase family 4 protein n=1 Tax=Alkalicoccus luteus TaxID=1237094 RepID=A0A969TWN6_9BACI|nr:glycosyltransferase family 4 protein [Alkalicoccus luteus]NJP37449.1 glycosyltransferase family 4 protein [Alkalicoccus luteus]